MGVVAVVLGSIPRRCDEGDARWVGGGGRLVVVGLGAGWGRVRVRARVPEGVVLGFLLCILLLLLLLRRSHLSRSTRGILASLGGEACLKVRGRDDLFVLLPL